MCSVRIIIPSSLETILLLKEVPIANMKLVWADANDGAILLVKLLDFLCEVIILKVFVADFYITAFVLISQSRNLGPMRSS